MTNKSKLPSTARVIFGAAGNLTWVKLIPALYDLYIDSLLLRQLVVMVIQNQNSMEDEHDPCFQ